MDEKKYYEMVGGVLLQGLLSQVRYLWNIKAITDNVYPAKLLFNNWLGRIAQGVTVPLYYYSGEMMGENEYLEALSDSVVFLAGKGETRLPRLKETINELISGVRQVHESELFCG